MREDRMKNSMRHTSPEEEKISNHLGRERAEVAAFKPVKSYEELDRIMAENWILRNKVSELQKQLQDAYIRIRELKEDRHNKQMELFE